MDLSLIHIFCVKKDTAGALPISIGVLIFVTTVRYYADVEYRLSLNYRGFFFYYLFIAVGYAIGMALYGISHSWVSIFILGEMLGLLFVTITGSIFKKPFVKKSQFFREDAKTCVSLSSAYLLSDFVTYTDRVVPVSYTHLSSRVRQMCMHLLRKKAAA